MSHIRSLKASVIGRSLCFHGASSVDELPGLAVGRAPDVAGRGGERLEPAAEDPELVLVDDLPAGVARLPPRLVRHPHPVEDLVIGRGARGDEQGGRQDDGRPSHGESPSPVDTPRARHPTRRVICPRLGPRYTVASCGMAMKKPPGVTDESEPTHLLPGGEGAPGADEGIGLAIDLDNETLADVSSSDPHPMRHLHPAGMLTLPRRSDDLVSRDPKSVRPAATTFRGGPAPTVPHPAVPATFSRGEKGNVHPRVHGRSGHGPTLHRYQPA